MTVKILTQEEYEHLKDTAYETLVSELEFTLLANDIVAVSQPNGTYKVLKFSPREETFPLIVTKEQLQQFIFLHGI